MTETFRSGQIAAGWATDASVLFPVSPAIPDVSIRGFRRPKISFWTSLFGHNHCVSSSIGSKPGRYSVRFSSITSTLLMMVGAIVVSSSEGNAHMGCDTHQLSSKPVAPNAISVDLVIPFGYLCYFLEVYRKEISIQKAAYTSNATVSNALVKGICNWSIDFVYYDLKGKEYLRDKGETVKGCEQGAYRETSKNKTLPQPGSSCAELITDGEVRLVHCHSLKE